MLKILAVIGCILLCLIVLVLWVIIVPRAVFVEYTENDGVEWKVYLCFFCAHVLPKQQLRKCVCKKDLLVFRCFS